MEGRVYNSVQTLFEKEHDQYMMSMTNSDTYNQGGRAKTSEAESPWLWPADRELAAVLETGDPSSK